MELYYCASKESTVLIGPLDTSSSGMLTMGRRGLETDITEFMDILGEKDNFSPLPKEYELMCQQVGVPSKEKILTVPKDKLQKHFNIVLEQLQKILRDPSNSFYIETYASIRKFLWSLERAHVDRKKIDNLIQQSDNLSVKGTLKSFVPDDDGTVDIVRYSMSATSTGRLVVKTGPKILTAPAIARKCLKSRHPEGQVLQIDIVSAEPKFALHHAGVSPPHDVYDYLSKNILESSVTRKNSKLVTLCALYGQSLKKLTKQLPENIGARSVVRKTKEFFHHESLVSELRKNYLAGNFRNAIGRPLFVESDSPHLLISHYLQSSVAEGSLLMFSNFMSLNENNCNPIFVIHDALLIDSKKDFAESLLEQKTLELFLGDWRFEATVTQVGDI